VAKTGPTLVLDIDSASVGACVLTEGVERPTMSKVKRMPIGTGAVRETAALIPLLKEALGALLPLYADTKPAHVFIVLASPWFRAELRTLASKSEKPVKVTAHSIERVVSEYRKKEHGDGGHPLEAAPITVTVNGYRTLVEHSLLGTSLAITMYETATDAALVTTVTDALHTFAPHVPITWHTTPLVYAETILRLSGYEYATVVDVGGEMTDVMILSKRTLGFVGSIPEGSRSVTRTIAGKNPIADTASRLVMMTKGDLKDEERASLSESLRGASAGWKKSLNDILQEAGNTIPVPHHVFVVGERDELGWFRRVVEDSSTRGGVPTIVMPEFFNGALAFGDGGSYDASLALAALFFHMRNSHPLSTAYGARVVYSLQ